LRLFNKLVFY